MEKRDNTKNYTTDLYIRNRTSIIIWRRKLASKRTIYKKYWDSRDEMLQKDNGRQEEIE